MIPSRIARLNADGTTDTSFAPGVGPNGTAFAVTVRSTGDIVVGGNFSSVSGVVRNNVVVFDNEGVILDSVADTDGIVRTVTGQANGEVFAGGDFVGAGSFMRNRAFRLQADNTVEPAFNPDVNDTVWCSYVQADGRILIGGSFSSVAGIDRTSLARLLNSPAETTLTVQDSATVFWERAATSPETEIVVFELSTDGGSSYAPLGYGTRAVGGWQLTGLTLDDDGLLRATAFPSTSQSQGTASETIPFDFVPEIQVEQPEGNVLESGVSSISYSTLQTGVTEDRTFVIRNIGLEDLTLDNSVPPPITLSGTNADQWEVLEQPPLVISPNGTVEFTVRFAPDATGSKSATLTIKSDDADEATFTVALTGVATPGPGARDSTFQPVINLVTYSVSLDYLNRVTIGGDFRTVNSVSRNRFARLQSTGAVDSSLTGTGANNTVYATAALPDAGTLAVGQFTLFNGSTRNRIAKVNEIGTLDGVFRPSSNGIVYSVDVQQDGKVLVAGSFTTIAGVSRPGVARILSTGVTDPSFSPTSSAPILGTRAMLLGDGKVLVVGGTLYKLTSSGARDTTFGTGGEGQILINGGAVNCVAEQADGKLVLGGNFTAVSGVSKACMARLNTDGTVDTGFTCDTVGSVQSLVIQTDGSIVVVGSFITFSGEAVNHAARCLSNGDYDPSFVTQVTAGTVYGAAIQEDGEVVITGDFTIGGSASVRAARLLNGSALDVLTVVSETEVQWLRSGTSAEVASVEFQFSQDSGVTWSSMGAGERIGGGWELTGTALPVSGILRALGSVMSGYRNSSRTLLESRVSFSGLNAPDITVEQPTNTIIADDATVQFAGKLVGQSGLLTFTIRNPGLATLSGLSVISTNATEFQVVSLGATSVAAGGTTTFQVRFTPAAIGFRTSTLTVASNVPGFKNPYTLNLTGNGITTPLATTNTPQSITSSAALLRGTVTARDDTSVVTFQWRLGSGAWNTVSATPSSASNYTATAVTFSLTGLTAATSYSYRVGITNSVTGPSSPVYGAVQTFNTLA